MVISAGKYRLKVWYLLVYTIYSHTIMINGFRLFSYVYAYGIPLLFLALHANDLGRILGRLRKRKLALACMFFLFMLVGTILSPIINRSYEFSFIVSGPIKRIALQLFVNMFLVLLYLRKVAQEHPSVVEYALYMVFAEVIYVLGTLVICIIPGLHDAVLRNMYMSELTQNVAQISYYYTRIGWNGYASFLPSVMCSLAIILCIIFAIESKKDRVINKVNVLLVIMLVGNFCYARTGVIVSAACIFLFLIHMIRNADIRILSYPVIAFPLIIVFGILVTSNEGVRNWYQWGFAQVIAYKNTGSFETSSISSLINMYKTLPQGITWLIGDGRYSTATGYYKSVDVGWLRSIYNHGLIIVFFQYGSLILVIWQFTQEMWSYLKKRVSLLVFVMLMILFVVFESKGEVWYHLFATLLPLCLIKTTYQREDRDYQTGL